MALQSPDYRLQPHGKGYVNYRGSTPVKIKKAFNKSGAQILAGAPITLDTSDNFGTEAPNVKSWNSVAQKILGFATQPNVLDYPSNYSNEYFPDNRPVSYVDSEVITLISETAFTQAQFEAVYIRHSGTGTVGNIRNAAVADETALLTGVKIIGIDLYDGVYYARVQVTPNLAFTANT